MYQLKRQMNQPFEIFLENEWKLNLKSKQLAVEIKESAHIDIPLYKKIKTGIDISVPKSFPCWSCTFWKSCNFVRFCAFNIALTPFYISVQGTITCLFLAYFILQIQCFNMPIWAPKFPVVIMKSHRGLGHYIRRWWPCQTTFKLWYGRVSCTHRHMTSGFHMVIYLWQ